LIYALGPEAATVFNSFTSSDEDKKKYDTVLGKYAHTFCQNVTSFMSEPYAIGVTRTLVTILRVLSELLTCAGQ
jgi:hypothetical protein